MEWRPNKWIAAVLGLFGGFLGLLYVIRLKWAVIYLVIGLTIALSEFLLVFTHTVPWLETFSLSNINAMICAVHAFRSAAHGPVHTRRPWYSKWYGITAILLLLLIVFFIFRAFLYEPFRSSSANMAPSIMQGDYMIVKKWGYGNYGGYGLTVLRTPISADIKRGDIIVFEPPYSSSVYVKRVIGLPGDHVGFGGQQLTLNGVLVKTSPRVKSGGNDDPYVYKTETLDGSRYTVVYNKTIRVHMGGSVTIPAGNYFVLGDNRDYSNDSRYWGFVTEKNIVGKVVYASR